MWPAVVLKDRIGRLSVRHATLECLGRTGLSRVCLMACWLCLLYRVGPVQTRQRSRFDKSFCDLDCIWNCVIKQFTQRIQRWPNGFSLFRCTRRCYVWDADHKHNSSSLSLGPAPPFQDWAFTPKPSLRLLRVNISSSSSSVSSLTYLDCSWCPAVRLKPHPVWGPCSSCLEWTSDPGIDIYFSPCSSCCCLLPCIQVKVSIGQVLFKGSGVESLC